MKSSCGAADFVLELAGVCGATGVLDVKVVLELVVLVVDVVEVVDVEVVLLEEVVVVEVVAGAAAGTVTSAPRPLHTALYS